MARDGDDGETRTRVPPGAPRATPPPATPGARYRWGERLEDLPGGALFRAHDTRLQREVRLRTLSSPAQAERCRVVARLNVPGLPGLLDLAADASPPYLVLERPTGRRLPDLLPEARLAALAQAARGLAALHDAGYAHGNPGLTSLRVGEDGVACLHDLFLGTLPGVETGEAADLEALQGLVAATLAEEETREARPLRAWTDARHYRGMAELADDLRAFSGGGALVHARPSRRPLVLALTLGLLAPCSLPLLYPVMLNYLAFREPIGLREHPRVVEHLGDVDTVEVDWEASPWGPFTDLVVFRLEGTRGRGRVFSLDGEPPPNGGEWRWIVTEGELELEDGTRLELFPEAP